MSDSATWRNLTWQDLTFEVPSSWRQLPGQDLTVVHPLRDDLDYTPTFTARYVPTRGRSLPQLASLASAVMTSTAPKCLWLDTAPFRLSSGTEARNGRRQVFLHASPAGELVSYQWLMEDGERLLEMSAHCTVAQSRHLQPLMLHLGDSVRQSGDGSATVAPIASTPFDARLSGFPDREPRLDEFASKAHGMPLETLDKVRGFQAWSHQGGWFNDASVREIEAGGPLDSPTYAGLGLPTAGRDRPAELQTLDSPHRHTAVLHTPRGSSSVDFRLSRDGFAGWAAPGLVSMLNPDPAVEAHRLAGDRQFVSGTWDALPKTVLSWAGAAPAWLGWPPVTVDWSVIEDHAGQGQTTSGTAGTAASAALPEPLRDGRWWLLRLAGMNTTPQPWLLTERHGGFAITGEPGDDQATLVQVSALTVFTSLVEYWDEAIRGVTGGSGTS
ncbi:hypothetical protein F7P69_18940 [Cellulosimicrobium funkei]|nr:hypothetical protein [Cellulosimicrobium funkei]